MSLFKKLFGGKSGGGANSSLSTESAHTSPHERPTLSGAAEGEDDTELIRPDATRVASRALVLSAITCRASIEGDAGNPDAEKFRGDVHQWLLSLGIGNEIEPVELALLTSPLGSLTSEQHADASWRAEGMGVLAWALGYGEPLVYDEPVASRDVANDLGFMFPAGDTALDDAEIDEGEVTAFGKQAIALHWRMRQFSLTHRPMEFEKELPTMWFAHLMDSSGMRFIDGDLAIDDLPLSKAPEQRFFECLRIAMERQRAANWLCGDHPIYSEVGTDT